MPTIAVIGAGELGASVAFALAAHDRVGDVVLIDDAAHIAAGKALDIQQSAGVQPFHSRIRGTDDLSLAVGAKVCVVADRADAGSREWIADEGLAKIDRLRQLGWAGPLVFAGAEQADLIRRVAHELNTPRQRLIGSAPEALTSAVKAVVALDAGCSPADVSIAVLGVPPDGVVIPWSEASIAGYALDRVLTQAQIRRLETRVIRLWPPGTYTLAVAAARVAEAVVSSSRRVFNALIVLAGELGVKDHVASLPVHLFEQGVRDVNVPALNTRERVRLETVLRG